MRPASCHLVRLVAVVGPIENPGPSIFAGASRKVAGRACVGCATLAAAPSNVWQVVRESNPRVQVLETRQIPDPDLRWSDRRDSNPHCRVGSAAVFLRRPIASTAPERFERSSSRLTSARIAAIMLQGITGGGAGNRTLIRCLQDSHPTVERNPRDPKLGRASGFDPEPARSHRVVQRHYTMPATSSSLVVVGAATSTCTRLSALRVRRVALYALATDLPEEGFEPPRRCV